MGKTTKSFFNRKNPRVYAPAPRDSKCRAGERFDVEACDAGTYVLSQIDSVTNSV